MAGLDPWFSAADLARLGEAGIAALPRSIHGCRLHARRKGWETREVSGRGGREGKLTQYKPDDATLEAIRTAQASSRPANAPRKTYVDSEGEHEERRKAERRHGEPRETPKLPIPPEFEPVLFEMVIEAIDEVIDPAGSGMSIESEGFLVRGLYHHFKHRRANVTKEELVAYLHFCLSNDPASSA